MNILTWAMINLMHPADRASKETYPIVRSYHDESATSQPERKRTQFNSGSGSKNGKCNQRKQRRNRYEEQAAALEEAFYGA